MIYSDKEKEAIEHFEILNEIYKKTNYNYLDLKYTDSEYDNSKILLNLIKKQDKIITEAIKWIENTMNDPNIRGCNLGDLQLLLDILEGE